MDGVTKGLLASVNLSQMGAFRSYQAPRIILMFGRLLPELVGMLNRYI